MILRIDKIAVPLPVPESPDQMARPPFSVGMLETRVFHPDSGEVEFNASSGRLRGARGRADSLYNAGGLDLKVGAEGVQLGGKHSNRS